MKEVFIKFKALVENRFKHIIITLFSDNGGEFIALRAFLSEHGITHLTSPPHTLEHNGMSERKHRHVVETGLTLLSQASLPSTYWTYAFTAAVYLINRMTTPIVNNQSPYFVLFGTQPNYMKLRVFGCACYPWLRPYAAHKLDRRSALCVFLGYSLSHSAYLCLDRSSGRIYTSRHVTFDENQFPFKTVSTEPAPIPDAAETPIPFTPPTPVPTWSLIRTQPPSQDPHLLPAATTSSNRHRLHLRLMR